jgi:hypothetical protein
LAIANSWIEYRLNQKALGQRRKNIMDILRFKVYICEFLSFAATAKRQAVNTSSDSEAENMTPRPTHTQNTSTKPNQDARRSCSSHLLLCTFSDKTKWMRCQN